MSDSAAEKELRVSVATLNRVIFAHPQNGTSMLALERKATVLSGNDIHIIAQPFGGAVCILNSAPLQEIIGEIQFDSELSKHEQDFRILIPPSKWESVKQYCLSHLENPQDPELESLPHRELAEEFMETIHANLNREQYTLQALGTIVENNPIPTENMEVQGLPTVRLYRIFEARVIDGELCEKMLAASQSYSDRDLEMFALKDRQNGGRGRANSILILPLHIITESYLKFAPEIRYRKVLIENHELDESVLAILDNVDVQQYQRV